MNSTKQTPSLSPDARKLELAKRMTELQPIIKDRYGTVRENSSLPDQNSVLDGLSRLLATENLNFHVDPSSPTASFDMKSRTLTIPSWRVHFYIMEMLVGHEVGHALYTPTDQWETQRVLKGTQYAPAFQSYMNIVEDDRIERMIQARFPGYRPIFYRAYRDLHNTGIFGFIDDEFSPENLSKQSLADRLNLFSKVGAFVKVPFLNATEEALRDRFKNSKTFEEVIQIASEVWDYDCQNQQQPKSGGESSSDSNGQDGVSMPGKNKQKSKPKGKDSDNCLPDDDGEDQDDSDESDKDSMGSNEGGEAGKDSDDGDSEGDSDSDGLESNSENGDSDTDSTSDGVDDPADDELNSGDDSESPVALDKDYGGNGKPMKPSKSPEEMSPLTEKTFRQNLENLTGGERFFNLTLHSVDPTDWIVCRSQNSFKEQDTLIAVARAFMNGKAGIVNNMVRLFNEKKMATDTARVNIAKTGMIDPTRLNRYRFDDDIFRRNITQLVGKNHGIIMLLDWSGSIIDVVAPMIEQCALFAVFCRKLKIPFTLMSFMAWPGSSLTYQTATGMPSYDPKDVRLDPDYWTRFLDIKGKPLDPKMYLKQRSFDSDSPKDVEISPHINYRWIDTAAMNEREFLLALGYLLLAGRFQSCRGYTRNKPYNYGVPEIDTAVPSSFSYYEEFDNPTLWLGGTPLNESLLVMRSFMDYYQKANKYEISNLIVVTDGQSNSDFPANTRYTATMGTVHDKKTGKVFTIDIRQRNCQLPCAFPVGTTETYFTPVMYDYSLAGTLRLMRMLRSLNECNLNLVYVTSGTQCTRIAEKLDQQGKEFFKNPKNPNKPLATQFVENNRESFSFTDGYCSAVHIIADPTQTYTALATKQAEYNTSQGLSASKTKKLFSQLANSSKVRGTFFIQQIIPIIAQSPVKNDPALVTSKKI